MLSVTTRGSNHLNTWGGGGGGGAGELGKQLSIVIVIVINGGAPLRK